jgi:hypothetical protein
MPEKVRTVNVHAVTVDFVPKVDLHRNDSGSQFSGVMR